MAGRAVQSAAGSRAIRILRNVGVFTFAAFIALCGLVTPFLRDDQIGYRPGFTLVLFGTIILAGWIGLGAGPVGRWARARCAESPRLTQFLSSEETYLHWFDMGTTLRLMVWPLVLGLGIGLAYARVLGL